MRFRLEVLVVFGVVSGVGFAQQAAPPQLPGQTSAPVPSAALTSGPAAQTPFAGSVPLGPPVPGVLPLTLEDAIARGLKANLGLYLGEQGTRLSQGAWYISRSNLLPNLSGQVSDAGEQINLKALGFTGAAFPGFSPIVGPFNVFDARGYLTQTVLNMTALRNYRAANQNLAASRLSYQDARDIVTLVVASLYLQALASDARITAARAQVATADALYKRAVDQKAAGVVAGIDVVRAQVELQAQQQRLIFFENAFAKSKLSLAHAIGLAPGQQFSLTTPIPYAPAPPLTFDEALALAYQNRSDYRAAEALVQAAELTKKAAEAQRYPAVAFTANYGAIGPRPWNSHGTFTVAGAVMFPIFEGGRIRGQVLLADAALEQRRAERDNLRAAINYELQADFLDLKSASDQVNVARSALDLARQQLTQSQDRFAAGVTNNLEVVQAQEAVATADENYISSLYAYNTAKAALARAVGGAERTVMRYLSGSK
jgi:outer membrane protein TolC